MKIRRILLPAALAGTCLLSLSACALSLTSLFVLLSKHPEPTTQPAALQWRQLESSDAARYAENLRAIGCPAPTIQAILGQTPSGDSSGATSAAAQARAHAAPAVATTASAPAPASPISPQAQTFAERRAAAIAAQAQCQSEAQSYAAASNPASSYIEPAQAAPESATAPGVDSTSGIGRANATYSGESAPASYAQSGGSGSISSGGNASAGARNAGPVQTIVAPDANSPIPAAFMDAPPSTHLNATQAHQLDQIQGQFANSVSGGSADPSSTSPQPPQNSNAAPSGNSSSPTSVSPKTWKTNTSLSDQQFRATFGDQSFLTRQNQANLHKSN